MQVKKVERVLTMDRVRTDKPLDPGAICNPQLGHIQVADFGVFAGNRPVIRDAVKMPTLDHKRPRRNQRRHLGVVKSVS